MNKLTVENNQFLLNGKPFTVVSGAMHYFRVPREYWRDRLLKLKACGFNTVETYCAWNLHEPEEGVYNFEGNLDLKAYLDLINELGMLAIVRPGPYICSEWEFGGFPWWLLKYDDIELRCMNERYIEKVDRYFDKLIPIISCSQTDCGGPVIMVQVENEYGSYGNDSVYIRYLAEALKNRGVTAELFTSDGDCDFMLSGGTVPEIFKTCNFGSKAEKSFKALRRFQPNGPLMCAEYWNGWFDHWTEKHHRRTAEDAAETLDEILSLNASVSVYMAHGGTNFGLMNGANCTDDEYQPTVNSYDDDAPVNEYGYMTPKYYAFKKVFAKHGFVNGGFEVNQPSTAEYPLVTFNQTADFLDSIPLLSAPVNTVSPLPMEKLGQGYGMILYTTTVKGPKEKLPLIFDAHDRAYVFADNKYLGCVYRNDKKPKIELSIPSGVTEISILVENMGRTNYGQYLADKKGIIGGVRLGQQFIYHWKTYCLPLDNINKAVFKLTDKPKFTKRPQLLKASFAISGEPKDTFVYLNGYKKGFIWINGVLLSRYWEVGPQHTAYLPAVFLKEGENEIVVLENEGYKKPEVKFLESPILE